MNILNPYLDPSTLIEVLMENRIVLLNQYSQRPRTNNYAIKREWEHIRDLINIQDSLEVLIYYDLFLVAEARFKCFQQLYPEATSLTITIKLQEDDSAPCKVDFDLFHKSLPERLKNHAKK